MPTTWASWFHLLGVGLWFLGLLRPLARRRGEGGWLDIRMEDLLLGVSGLFLLGMTGVLETIRLLPSRAALFITPLGWMVLFKGFLFSIVFSLETVLALKLNPFLRQVAKEGRTGPEEPPLPLPARQEVLDYASRMVWIFLMVNLVLSLLATAAAIVVRHGLG